MIKPTEGKLSLRAEHRALIHTIISEAGRVEGTARMIVDLASELLEKGGKLNVQEQMIFLTGALMRRRTWARSSMSSATARRSRRHLLIL